MYKILLVGNKRKYGKLGKGYRGGWFEELFREELIRTSYLDVYPFGWGYCDEEFYAKKSVLKKVEELGGVDVVLTSHSHTFIEDVDKLNALKVHFTRSFHDGKEKEVLARCYKHYQEMKYDVIFGNSSVIIDKLKKERIGGKHYLLPWGVDIGIHRKLGVEKEYDVGCFYTIHSSGGDYYSFRVKIRNMLKNMPISLYNRSTYFHGMVEKVNKSKICINHHPIDLVNCRVTEVLACGTFLLTNYCDEYEKFGYKDGKHLVLYDGLDDLSDKISYYLKDEGRREKIAESGRKFVRKYYNNARRVKDMAKIIKGHL